MSSSPVVKAAAMWSKRARSRIRGMWPELRPSAASSYPEKVIPRTGQSLANELATWLATVKVASARMGNWPELGQSSWSQLGQSQDPLATAWPHSKVGHTLVTRG